MSIKNGQQCGSASQVENFLYRISQCSTHKKKIAQSEKAGFFVPKEFFAASQDGFCAGKTASVFSNG